MCKVSCSLPQRRQLVIPQAAASSSAVGSAPQDNGAYGVFSRSYDTDNVRGGTIFVQNTLELDVNELIQQHCLFI